MVLTGIGKIAVEANVTTNVDIAFAKPFSTPPVALASAKGNIRNRMSANAGATTSNGLTIQAWSDTAQTVWFSWIAVGY